MMSGTNVAPMPPNCRCSVCAHSDRAEYEKWLEYLENGGTTEEYNKQKARDGNIFSAPAKHKKNDKESQKETQLIGIPKGSTLKMNIKLF